MCGRNHRKRYKRYNSGPIDENYSGGVSTLKHKIDVSPRTYCFICGFNNLNYSEHKMAFCQNCGAKIQLCPISKLKFNLGDEFGQCINCYTVFHLKHLKSWLQSNQRCPICKSPSSEVATGIIGKHKTRLE